MLIAIIGLFCFALPNLIEERFWQNIPVFFRNPGIQTFTIFLLAIVLEALPFILIGSVISGVIEVYLPQNKILGLFQGNRKVVFIPIAALIGLVMPICECGIVPVVRRLLKKGVPLSIAITYMLTGPIINLTVLASTSLAFWNKPAVIFWRPVLALLIGVTIGFLSLYFGREALATENEHNEYCSSHDLQEKNWKQVFRHAETDFFLMGKYLIIGAFAASFIQTVLPRESLLTFNRHLPLSILAMIIMAFLLNLCSEADAFVASTFIQFPTAAKIAFLVSGPMLDLKMVLMWLAVFRKRFIIFLAAAIVILVFLSTYILGNFLR